MYRKIKDLCNSAGITITGLESKLGFARGSLSKIDNHKLSAEKLQKIADYFGIRVDWLQGTSVLYSDNGEFCVSNTGLVTPSGKDILMFFTKNLKEGETDWFFKGFKTKVDREIMEYFHTTPELATYTENYQELYFNPNLNIEINTDHILDDNWDRIQQEIALPKSVVKTLLQGVVEEAKIKVKRNMRLVVPQFYNGTIMYLMPVSIPVSDDKAVTMALAIEKTGTSQYRANTILTKDMAYEKARLLMKPESNWLIEK